jgi:hypothetical protein
MRKQISNYARNVVTRDIIFFDDAHAPVFEAPEFWAFYRVPAGADAETFRGQLVGFNPAEKAASDPEAPAPA